MSKGPFDDYFKNLQNCCVYYNEIFLKIDFRQTTLQSPYLSQI